MPPSSEILILSIERENPHDERPYKPLYKALAAMCSVKKFVRTVDVTRYLADYNPKAVLITDEGITKPNGRDALQTLKAYVQEGGLAIFGFNFPLHCPKESANKMFRDDFGLTWRRDGVVETEVEYNNLCALPFGLMLDRTSRPAPFISRFHYMIDARFCHNIVRSTFGLTGSDHWPIAPIVVAQVGKGYVAYFGNSIPDRNCNKLILKLCGF